MNFPTSHPKHLTRKAFVDFECLPAILAVLLLAGMHALGAIPTETPPPDAVPPSMDSKIPGAGIGQGIVVRTTENVTKGGWVWILNQCERLGIDRIDLLVKQDEDNFHSQRTGATLQSGDLLLPLSGEKCAPGWEDAGWLREMFVQAKLRHIKIWAWWPCFHDVQAADLFPAAKYQSERGETFVDPAVAGVRERQSMLISKLLESYPFDGVSLDWVRYEGWPAGKDGPLGVKFVQKYPEFKGFPDILGNDYSKARWYEMRAQLLADWVADLVRSTRAAHPEVRWGAFLEPWQFTETSLNYGMLGRAGLDYLEPMGYWQDWKQEPEWVGNKLLSQHDELTDGTSQWLTLGIDAPPAETERALTSVPNGALAGLSWFTFGTWEQKSFDRLENLLRKSDRARELFGYVRPNPDTTETRAIHAAAQTNLHRSEGPHLFPKDSSIWSVICLAELYKTGALEAKGDDPLVPVLALHTLEEGAASGDRFPYKCSTEYLDNLFAFIKVSGFNVAPMSRFQSYLITRDTAMLPSKPLVITIDDGSESVYQQFFPRAKKLKIPFTTALVTSWLSDGDQSNHSTIEPDRSDKSMTWKEVREMYDTGLLEVVSHSDAMHYQTALSIFSEDSLPAEVSTQFLKEFGRPETNSEYMRRIRIDMETSRSLLASHGFRASSIFCWPYGEYNQTSRAIAESAGFTHFLLFDTPPVIANARNSRQGIPRLPVLHADESVPLVFPSQPDEAQTWWLAFLQAGIDSRSIPLLNATLSRLTKQNQNRTEAKLAVAALDFLHGDPAGACARLSLIQKAYPLNPAVGNAVADLIKKYNPPPL